MNPLHLKSILCKQIQVQQKKFSATDTVAINFFLN